MCDPKSSQALVEFVGNNKNFQYSDEAKLLIWLGFDFRKIHHTPSFATQKRLYPTVHYLIKNGKGSRLRNKCELLTLLHIFEGLTARIFGQRFRPEDEQSSCF